MTEQGTAQTPESPLDVRAGVTAALVEGRTRRDVLDRVFPLIYDELRRIARGQLKGEDDGHTLSTTALVHEAYLRLVDVTRVEWRDRVHFLAMASRAMRRVLIDHARQHRAEKRGGGARPITLEDADSAGGLSAASLIALDDALERLRVLNPRVVQVVECRYFGGMTEEETAQALDVTSRTVRNDWVMARGWLRRALD